MTSDIPCELCIYQGDTEYTPICYVYWLLYTEQRGRERVSPVL